MNKSAFGTGNALEILGLQVKFMPFKMSCCIQGLSHVSSTK